MNASAQQLAAAGRELVGVRYRLHGRNPSFGLDCAGVIIAAFAACGVKTPEITDYGMRNRTVPKVSETALLLGLRCVHGAGEDVLPGDVLVTRPGPAQWHLLLAVSKAQFVHAHAGLRKVVLANHPLPHPVCQHWRLAAFL